ncbi:MAG: CopG family transcriptional regulator [Gammaproteobacteria bacterium]|nr:CopG family transcriptional regulator [Gammaproteobacteria bacterium]
MITLRLDPKLEKTVSETARILGVTKSELVRRSIAEFIERVGEPTPWELGKDLFERYESGRKNNSRDRKSLIREKLRVKQVR